MIATIAVAAPAGAKPAPAQKLFAQKLLASDQVSSSIKATLQKGGFVSRDVLFGDLTGEGKDDAVVTVDSGGAAGIVAVYVFSALSGKDLKIVYRNQRLYRAMVRLNPGPSLVYTLPQWKQNDELCCPSEYRETELKWSAKSKGFAIARRRTLPADLIARR